MTEATGRLLPELSEDNEFFWKSGEDGTLRFQRCTGCGDLRHPPSAVCPYCRSTEWEPAAVSGRGVVAGFTRNEQMWQPSFPPPYVIAIVAIEEDDRIRLTTNLVNCSPDDVFVGMKVQVRFEHEIGGLQCAGRFGERAAEDVGGAGEQLDVGQREASAPIRASTMA